MMSEARRLRRPLLSGVDDDGREFELFVHPIQKMDRKVTVMLVNRAPDGERQMSEASLSVGQLVQVQNAIGLLILDLLGMEEEYEKKRSPLWPRIVHEDVDFD